MKRIAVIYHDADFDGKLSNEVCRFHLNRIHPDAAIHSYGWDYGRPVPMPYIDESKTFSQHGWPLFDAIYIVDLSVDDLMSRSELRSKIVWIDHHKSAIEKWEQAIPFDGGTQPLFNGLRIDGVAACRLCWQWFMVAYPILPKKQDYIDRTVHEPALIRLAGEYDIWDHRDPNAKVLQFGLRSLMDEQMSTLITQEFDDAISPPTDSRASMLGLALNNGSAIKSYCDKQNDAYSADYSTTLKWEGLTFCCLNIGQRGNSDLLRGGIKTEHEACFAWRHTGDSVTVSLYHVPGNEHIDLSKIAVKYGGGGHRGACGFRVSLSDLQVILSN